MLSLFLNSEIVSIEYAIHWVKRWPHVESTNKNLLRKANQIYFLFELDASLTNLCNNVWKIGYCTYINEIYRLIKENVII